MQFELDMMNSSLSLELEIYNTLGQKVGHKRIVPFQSIVPYDVTDFSDGIYFAVVRDKTREVARTKFVVEHP